MSSKYGAMWGAMIGDSMAMPVHWYYNIMDIKKDYGSWLTGYVAPKEKHPTSIMHLSATGGSGRSTGTPKPEHEVIGNVILHDKAKYWGKAKGVHYHHGMKAGENTLNSTLSFEINRVLQEVDPDVTMDPRELRGKVMEHYIKFLTTPGTHNDTYAESSHRSFFKDWLEQDSPPRDGPGLLKLCGERFGKVDPEQEDAQIPCASALVLTVPWILHYAESSEDVCANNAADAIILTHASVSLRHYVDLYARLLRAVVRGADLRTEILKTAASPVLGTPNKAKVIEKFSQQAATQPKGSNDRLTIYQEAVAIMGMACYLNGSMPALLFLAYEFADDLKEGVLANTNCGGENVGRGSAIGALLGAHAVNIGADIPSDLIHALVMYDTYSKLIH